MKWIYFCFRYCKRVVFGFGWFFLIYGKKNILKREILNEREIFFYRYIRLMFKGNKMLLVVFLFLKLYGISLLEY